MRHLARTLLTPTLLVVTCLCYAGPVPQPIKDRYRELAAVLNRVDFRAFQTFFAPEFVSVSPKGQRSNRKAFFAEVKPLFDAATRGIARERLISATRSGGLVNVKFELWLDLTGKGGTTKVHEAGVDTWKKVNGKWVLVKTVDTAFTVSVPNPK